MIRVLLVDDQAMMRAGFTMVLAVENDIEVVGEAADGRQAIDKARALRPDVIVMDVQMPNLDGIEATRQIVAEQLSRVIIVTTFDQDRYLFDGLGAGASGFMLKNSEPEALVEAIRAVADGHALLSPAVTLRVIEQATVARALAAAEEPEPDPRLSKLTEREREVLVELGHGRSNAEIANALFVGEATVKTHVSNLLTKLGLRDRLQLVVFAYESGLLRP